MKTIILVAAAMVLTMATAQAQDAGGMGGMGGGGRHHGQQQKNAKAVPAKPKVDEKAYNSALKGIPNKPYDAWHGVR